MNASRSQIKRTRLFVDANIQGSLVRQLIIHWCLACTLVFLYLITMQAFSNGFALGFTENLTAVVQQYGLLGAIILVISPVFIYDSVKLSNRFVGPMISFRNSLRRLTSGEVGEPLSFRRGDFWREWTDDYNQLIEEINRLRSRVRELEGSESTLEKSH